MTEDWEFTALVAACGKTFAGDEDLGIGAAADGIDWRRLLDLAARHRVEALAWHSLGPLDLGIPGDVAAEFSIRAAAIVERNLRTAIECRALARAFRAASIDLLFVKGLTLGALAYGSPYLKMGWDIDLLVATDRVADAAAHLSAAGYAPIVPAAPAEIAAWHRRHKESAWHRPGEFHLDLHSRLSDHRGLIAGIGMASPRQSVTVAPGIELATLGPDELFAYLCVHGASSAWFRLKWITDLAALLHAASEAEIERIYTQSQELGAGRAAGQALLLAERLYRTKVGEPLYSLLRRDRATRWLADAAMAQMADVREPTGHRLGTATIHASQLLLQPGWRPALSEFGRQAADVLTGR